MPGCEGPDLRLVRCRTALSPSRLPGLDWALNPYRGCTHACAYCYAQDVTRFEVARPWGSVLEVKTNVVQVLRRELQVSRDGVVGIGTVTDPYQPSEERFQLTRGCLSLLRSKGMEASLLTKSPLVLRDLDVIEGWLGVEVGLSIASMEEDVCSVLEPGAPSPEKRMAALRALIESGVNTYLMAAPIVPGLSDNAESLEALVSRAASAGVRRIIWDMYNPKPGSQRRLTVALRTSGLIHRWSAKSGNAQTVRRLLQQACTANSIELSDAF